MKICIEIPDIKFNEFDAFEIFKNIGLVPDEFKDAWTTDYSIDNGFVNLTLETVVDGEVISKILEISYDDMITELLKSIKHFEYDGRYGANMRFSTGDPEHDERIEGNLNDFLKELVSSSLKSGFSYGYIE